MAGDIDFAELGFSVRSDGVVVATHRLEELEKKTRKAETAQERLARQADKVGRSMRDVGRNLTLYVTAPIIAIAGLAVKAASDFEDSFADIRKTVDATEEQFAQMSDEMRALARTVPTTVEELNRIGGVAGQLGVAQENIVEFTRVIAMLGDTTDVAGEQAALSLTRFMNIMGTAQGDIDRVGSTIVGLGNNFAAMESEIIHTATSLAAFGSQMNLTEADVLAFATAIAASGGETQAASTAFQKTASTMQRAVLEMNEDLAIFAKTAGVSAAEFARAFREDAASAILLFLRGLERISDQGLSTAAVLEKIGLADQRLLREFGKVIGNLDQLDEALVRSTEEWEKNTALTEEAEKRYKTFASEMAIFRNQIKDVAIELGTALLPHIRAMRDDADGLIATLRRWVEAFRDADPATQKLIIKTVAFVAVLGPLLVALGAVVRAIGTLMPLIVRLGSVLVTLGATAITTTQAISRFGLGLVALNIQAAISTSRLIAFAGPVGVAVGAVALLIPRLLDAAENAKTLAGALDLSSDAADRFAVAIEKATTVSELDDELQEIRSAATLLERELIKINEELSVFPDHRDTQSNPLFQRLLEEKERVSSALMDLQEDYNNLRGKQRELVTEAEQSAAALGEVAEQAGNVADSFDTDAFQRLLDYLEPSVKAMRELAKARALLNKARGKLGEEEFQRLLKLLESSDLALEAYSNSVDDLNFDQWTAALEALIDEQDELNAEQEEFNRRLQELRDIGDPVAALVRRLTEQMRDLDLAVKLGTMSERERQQILNVLTDELGRAAAATLNLKETTDAWKEAGLEAVRILERAFTNAWSNIRNGFKGLLDGLLDGFETQLSSILHLLFTSPLVKSLQGFFENGTQFDWKTLGIAAGGIAGVGLGTLLGGGGEFASIGSAIGTAFGSAALSKLFPALFTSLGVFGGPLGAALGGIFGGLLGGLFDDSPEIAIQLVGEDVVPLLGGYGNQRTNVDTALGGFVVTNTGDFDQESVQKFLEGVANFDNALAEILDEGQLDQVTNILKQWGLEVVGSGATLDNLLQSRLDAIQYALSEASRIWVNEAENLQEEIMRTGIAFRAETLFEEQPELFDGRTQREFLAVVEAFADGTKTIAEAFDEVIATLMIVESATRAIREFADSDFIADYERFVMLQNETPVDTLTRLSSELFDAVSAFDNTPEQLVQIANAFGTIREAGINAIAHIDAAWKGLTATIDRLRQDTLDIIRGPKSEREIFIEAAGLVDLAKTAQTPEELARLGTEFDSLIRQLSPETIQRLGPDILRLIDDFDAAADASFERIRDQTLDAIESMQLMADAFLTRIPDALMLVASTNERAAAALEVIAGTGDAGPSWVGNGALIDIGAITNVLGTSALNQEQILVDGTNKMAAALRSGTVELQNNIASAIQNGFGNANIVVNVQISDNSLNNL